MNDGFATNYLPTIQTVYTEIISDLIPTKILSLDDLTFSNFPPEVKSQEVNGEESTPICILDTYNLYSFTKLYFPDITTFTEMVS